MVLIILSQRFLFSRVYIMHICSSDGIYLRVKVLTLVIKHVKNISDENGYFSQHVEQYSWPFKICYRKVSIPLDSSC